MLRNMGERGLLATFPALIWGRPPAGDNANSCSRQDAIASRAANRAAILRAVNEYNRDHGRSSGRRLRTHHPAMGPALRRSGSRRWRKPTLRAHFTRRTWNY